MFSVIILYSMINTITDLLKKKTLLNVVFLIGRFTYNILPQKKNNHINRRLQRIKSVSEISFSKTFHICIINAY